LPAWSLSRMQHNNGWHFCGKSEAARGHLCLCAIVARNGHQITAWRPPHLPTADLAKGKTSASSRAPSLIRQVRRLDLHPCGDFGQLHMHGKGAGNGYPGLDGQIAATANRRSVPVMPAGETRGCRQAGRQAALHFPTPLFFGGFGTALRSNGVVGHLTCRACPPFQVAIQRVGGGGSCMGHRGGGNSVRYSLAEKLSV
jgi:hypothetical protein